MYSVGIPRMKDLSPSLLSPVSSNTPPLSWPLQVLLPFAAVYALRDDSACTEQAVCYCRLHRRPSSAVPRLCLRLHVLGLHRSRRIAGLRPRPTASPSPSVTYTNLTPYFLRSDLHVSCLPSGQLPNIWFLTAISFSPELHLSHYRRLLLCEAFWLLAQTRE